VASRRCDRSEDESSVDRRLSRARGRRVVRSGCHWQSCASVQSLPQTPEGHAHAQTIHYPRSYSCRKLLVHVGHICGNSEMTIARLYTAAAKQSYNEVGATGTATGDRDGDWGGGMGKAEYSTFQQQWNQIMTPSRRSLSYSGAYSEQSFRYPHPCLLAAKASTCPGCALPPYARLQPFVVPQPPFLPRTAQHCPQRTPSAE